MPSIEFIHITGKKPASKTRTYTAESCHEIGYIWRITAPQELDPIEIERLQQALIGWTDEPVQENLVEVLQGHDDYVDASEERISLLMKVRFELDTVHRDYFTQSFKETTATAEDGAR